MTKKIQKTINEVFFELNKKNLNYAVLRNFDNLKKLYSDIDIIYNGPLNDLKKLLSSVAKKNNWTYLVYDKNKSKFFSYNNKIEIFYFIDDVSLNFIQIDIFRSIPLMSTPYYKLKNSQLYKISNSYIKTIPKNISYTYHLFQIGTALNNPKINAKKINLYKKRFLSLKFKEIYKKNIFFEESILENLRVSLHNKSFKKFLNILKIYKLLIFLNFYFTNFFYILNIFHRIYEIFLSYCFRPWGIKLDFYFKNKKEKIKITNFIKRLKKNKIIYNWKIHKELNLINYPKFMERRNLLVRFLYKEKQNISNKKIFFHEFLKDKLILTSNINVNIRKNSKK